uniref:Uncharacterized protein n=1 Tax=Ditylenchus dipsaci TaxID=166011 RepID=A0A915DLI6_9BILA
MSFSGVCVFIFISVLHQTCFHRFNTAMSEGSSAVSSESIDYEEDSDYDLDEDKCMKTTEIENMAEKSEYAQKLTILNKEDGYVIYQKQMCDIGRRTKSSSHRANFLETLLYN